MKFEIDHKLAILRKTEEEIDMEIATSTMRLRHSETIEGEVGASC